MMIFKKKVCFMLLCVCATGLGYAQNGGIIALNSLNAFNNPEKNWQLAADVNVDFNKPESIKFLNGAGVVVNTSKSNGGALLTKQDYGDVEIKLDFMMTKAAASAIYLEGRYGIKLADSWTVRDPTTADAGAIIPRAGENGLLYEGSAPLMNVSRAPGLWQHLRIKFRAPKFEGGVKITDARFEEVYINGTLVQLQSEITGPVQGAAFTDEQATGPLMLLGNNGVVAFKNITYLPLKPLPGPPGVNNPLARQRMNVVNPMIVKVESKPYLLRSFLMFNNKKRTHVISVGSPEGVSYSYDLKQGALLQLWRGDFLDVTEMWNDRGEPQLAKPLGSVLPLSAAPALAVLKDKDTAWPDSVMFDDLQNKGYTLDKNRMPTFTYSFGGAEVTDKISVLNNGESLQRDIAVTNAPDMFYCRIAAGTSITAIKNGVYIIGDKEYYIKLDEELKPTIRNAQNGQELLVPVGKNATLTYSITW